MQNQCCLTIRALSPDLMERYKDEVEELKKAHWPYKLRKPGRRVIKRYIALLGNLELRQQVFGF